jgi:NRPS condensation-like uncharacterized protein
MSAELAALAVLAFPILLLLFCCVAAKYLYSRTFYSSRATGTPFWRTATANETIFSAFSQLPDVPGAGKTVAIIELVLPLKEHAMSGVGTRLEAALRAAVAGEVAAQPLLQCAVYSALPARDWTSLTRIPLDQAVANVSVAVSAAPAEAAARGTVQYWAPFETSLPVSLSKASTDVQAANTGRAATLNAAFEHATLMVNTPHERVSALVATDARGIMSLQQVVRLMYVHGVYTAVPEKDQLHVALITILHHTVCDGMSGFRTMGSMLQRIRNEWDAPSAVPSEPAVDVSLSEDLSAPFPHTYFDLIRASYSPWNPMPWLRGFSGLGEAYSMQQELAALPLPATADSKPGNNVSTMIAREISADIMTQLRVTCRAHGVTVTSAIIAAFALAVHGAIPLASLEGTTKYTVSVILDMRPKLPDLAKITTLSHAASWCFVKLRPAQVAEDKGELWSIARSAQEQVSLKRGRRFKYITDMAFPAVLVMGKGVTGRMSAEARVRPSSTFVISNCGDVGSELSHAGAISTAFAATVHEAPNLNVTVSTIPGRTSTFMVVTPVAISEAARARADYVDATKAAAETSGKLLHVALNILMQKIHASASA